MPRRGVKRLLGWVLAAAAVWGVLAGCTSAGTRAAPSQTSVKSPTGVKNQGPRSTVTSSSASPAGAVWLCRPGRLPDPCVSDLDAQVVPASGTRTVQRVVPVGDSPFDCFYVYPTVDSGQGPNTDLTIQAAERSAAAIQAARF